MALKLGIPYGDYIQIENQKKKKQRPTKQVSEKVSDRPHITILEIAQVQKLNAAMTWKLLKDN